MQILVPQPRPTELETPLAGLNNLCLNKPSHQGDCDALYSLGSTDLEHYSVSPSSSSYTSSLKRFHWSSTWDMYFSRSK